MAHHINLNKDVLTIRITGQGNAQEIHQELLRYFSNQADPLTVLLDLTLATVFDRALKAMFYRILQHGKIGRLGICSSNPAIAEDVNELLMALDRLRTVTTAANSIDLMVIFGLAEPSDQPRKLTGMLSYIRKA
jgi:hypothetical protein